MDYSKTPTNDLKNIDFNYPYPNRKDLMSLSTINARDAPLKKFKQLDTNRDWSVNLYNLDIQGTSPRRVGAFNQKIDFTNKNDDIERSCPKILHVGLNKPEYNLSNRDIEYSSPGCVKIKTTRHLNPLEPKYQFSKCEPLPFEVPKFIRDNIQIGDIDGAKPKRIMNKWNTRESLKKDDIADSSPRKPYVRSTNYSCMDYRDVTHSEFRSGRLTNPLEPVYRLGYTTGEKIQIGPIDGNKPVVFSKYNYPDPYNLKVNDIIGSNAGSKNYINKFTGKNFIYTSKDIFGAQSGTLKKGIITPRHVNPLVPMYQYLGREELKGLYENNPYNNLSRNAKTTIPGKKNDKLLSMTNQDISVKDSHILKENSTIAEAGGTIVNTNKDVSPVPDEIKLDQTIKNVSSPVNMNKEPSPKLENSPKHENSPKPASPEPERNEVINNGNASPKVNPTVEENKKFELADVPYTVEVINFDKDKYHKPKPYYGMQHDEYIMPPIEGISKTELNKSLGELSPKANGATTGASKGGSKARQTIGGIAFNKPSFNSSLPSHPQTYAQKLDQFMNRSNLKTIEPNNE